MDQDIPSLTPPDASSIPIPLPPSDLYVLRSTATSGRGVFATKPISQGTLILNTSTSPTTSPYDPHSPLAFLIQRPYRKECCATCFAYNRGRDFKTRILTHDCGVVFCSETCRDAWVTWNGDIGIAAWEALEKGVKDATKRGAGANRINGDEAGDVQMQDIDANVSDQREGSGLSQPNCGPSAEQIEDEWCTAQMISEVVASAKTKAKPSKNEKKVLRNVIERGGDADLMYYMLTAVIGAWNLDNKRREASEVAEPDILTLLSPLFTLTSTLSAYAAHHTSLPLHISSYAYLHTILPPVLIPYLSPILAHNLLTRAAHNAFSLRPPGHSDGTDSGEFLGWAVYPAASFFNHSCTPNVEKLRVGRGFEFVVSKDVAAAEELCISYLGGEEKELDVRKRRARLKGEWGFICACAKCIEETRGDQTT